MSSKKTFCIATRGSALALAQANFILGECRRHFPLEQFELKIIKTTGDKLQTASLSQLDSTLPRGLFTKEIEDALLSGEADLAVHSLKDLPTILPDGLKLGAVGERADVRDVLIYRKSERGTPDPKMEIRDLPRAAIIATSSTRRSAQLLEQRPDLKIVPIRGNVGTRLQKLGDSTEILGIVLAAAGLERLGFAIDVNGFLYGGGIPAGLRATQISTEEMLPCVGQAALGIEVRENDPRIENICERLNDLETWHCITAERSFLRAMGGGCQSPVGAYAEAVRGELTMRVVSFVGGSAKYAQGKESVAEAVELGQQLAAELRT
ncbi:MAG: hydroxymethylbilane synthase [Verrucomicrobiota bacterium]